MFDVTMERARDAFGLRRRIAKWRRKRERAKAARLADQLRAAAKVMDARMQAAGLTRAQRRQVYRSCASAGSFAEVFSAITVAGRKS